MCLGNLLEISLGWICGHPELNTSTFTVVSLMKFDGVPSISEKKLYSQNRMLATPLSSLLLIYNIMLNSGLVLTVFSETFSQAKTKCGKESIGYTKQ